MKKRAVFAIIVASSMLTACIGEDEPINPDQAALDHAVQGKGKSKSVASCSVEWLSCDEIAITCNKDISNVVYSVDGQHTKHDGLSGYGYTLNISDVETVWVKSGNNKSGDGPGYGERFDRPDNPDPCAEEPPPPPPPPPPSSCYEADCSNDTNPACCDADTSKCNANGVCELVPGDIAGKIWLDQDGNGTQESTDPDIGQTLPIDLYADADADGIPDSATPLATTGNDTLGNYAFQNILGGFVVSLPTPYPTSYCGYMTSTVQVFPKNPKDTVNGVDLNLTPLAYCPQ